MNGSENITAMILAAGRSFRMGVLKPLLPLGKETFMERVINIAREAGIEDILSVVGYEAHRLIPLLERRHVRWVINPGYHRGMFSSLCTGVQSLDPRCRAFLLMPADMPLIRPGTLRGLLDVFQDGNVCRPRYQNRRGHPPLISAALVPDMLAYEGAGGLRAFLSRYENRTLNVDVDDPGILIDVDTPDDLSGLPSES